MILPMIKYSFLVHHTNHESFLSKLQEIGLVDIIISNKNLNEELKDKIKYIQKIQTTAKKLAKRINIEKQYDAINLTDKDLISLIEDLLKNIEHQKAQLNFINKNIERIAPWGEFSPELIKEIEENNYLIKFYICTESKFNSKFLLDKPHQIISVQQNLVHFVVINKKDEILEINFADEIQVPLLSIYKLKEEIKEIENDILNLDYQLDIIANKHLDELNNTVQNMFAEFDFDNVLSNKQTQVDDKVVVLEGWVPVTKVDNIESQLNELDVVFFRSKAEKSENVPILLKNNNFSKLFEPIGKLFSLPSYKEMDLTPFFAPFFMMFFGFCLGDFGYGVVLVLLATIFKRKVNKDLKPILSLVQLLGIGTIIFGAVSGTLFGVNLIETNITALANFQHLFLDADAMFQLALILGLIQMLFGMILKAINSFLQFGLAYAMPAVGWIILVLSLLDIAMLKLTSGFSVYAIYLSIGLIIWFSDPKGSIFSKLGKGIWELYGITGIFGDILSYIRLFALGISSAILGFVINDISLQVKNGIPYAGPVLFVVFLILGHAGNLLIASLGAFVHPMRLTFVEFYKNAGFMGGGKEYRPFKKKHKN